MTRSFLTGYEARGDRSMRATGVLQKCLGDSLDAIHAQRTRVLMRAVEATIAWRRLSIPSKVSKASSSISETGVSGLSDEPKTGVRKTRVRGSEWT